MSGNIVHDTTNKGSKQVGFWGQGKKATVTKRQDLAILKQSRTPPIACLQILWKGWILLRVRMITNISQFH